MGDDATLQAIVERLLSDTSASRCTLRQDIPSPHAFPVTHEALAPGVESIRELTSVDQSHQPVVRQILREPQQVVQDDAAASFEDPEFHRMRDLYGGLAAQIVTPVLFGGRVIGILSLHQLGVPRDWTTAETAACGSAAAEIAAVIGETGST